MSSQKNPGAIFLALLYFFVGALIVTFLFGCATPRSNSIFPLQFSSQAPRALMKIDCQGVKQTVQGVFACEEKSPRKASIKVKIMPTPGQVIYSNGLLKKVEDFNWRETGFFIWKKKQIKDTWAELDLGELSSIFGDSPIAYNIAGMSDKGVISNRGIIYYRICNDRDIPCSKMVVKYNCNGEVFNTWEGQLGSCVRMAGSSQEFEVPLKTSLYEVPKGSRVMFASFRSGWKFMTHVTDQDIDAGSIKVRYPNVLDGPDLIQAAIYKGNQGVVEKLDTSVLLAGFATEWTGIDEPHYYVIDRPDGRQWTKGLEFSMPVLSDLMEVVMEEEGKHEHTSKGKIKTALPKNFLCAYAWQRSSGDMTTICLDKNLNEMRHP